MSLVGAIMKISELLQSCQILFAKLFCPYLPRRHAMRESQSSDLCKCCWFFRQYIKLVNPSLTITEPLWVLDTAFKNLSNYKKKFYIKQLYSISATLKLIENMLIWETVKDKVWRRSRYNLDFLLYILYWISILMSGLVKIHTVKKGSRVSRLHAGMSLTKLPLGRNNSVMTSLFPPRESLVVTSRLGTENFRTFFYGAYHAGYHFLVKDLEWSISWKVILLLVKRLNCSRSWLQGPFWSKVWNGPDPRKQGCCSIKGLECSRY
jgi:hypothetical protein